MKRRMTDAEFHKWLFPPPPLSRVRKLVINLIMLAVTILVAYLFNDPSSPIYMGTFK
jgi:hypothetical protein